MYCCLQVRYRWFKLRLSYKYSSDYQHYLSNVVCTMCLFFMLAYRAPELFDVQSDCVIDTKTDVWSLGCTLYAMAYGMLEI